MKNIAALAAILLVSPTVRANGRPPNTTGVAISPANPNRLAVGLTFGLATSADGGKSWYWVCEDALGGPISSDAIVTMGSAGEIIVGNVHGLFVSTDGGCNFAAVGSFGSDLVVSSASVHPTVSSAWLVTANSTSNFQGGVYRTDDGGKTFTTLLTGDKGIFFYSVAVARTNPQRLIVAASNNAGQNSCLLRTSNDGGQTFTSSTVAGAPGASTTPAVAISPTDANVVLLGVLDIGSNQTALMRSSDGGQTFTSIGHADGPLRGMAFASDGVAAALGTVDRVYVSSDAAASFAALPLPAVDGCANIADARTLYGCGNALVDGFSLASSTNGGNTWQTRFQLPLLQGPYNCNATSQVYTSCMAAWAQEASVINASVAPLASPNTTTTGPAGAAKKSGCHCDAGGAADWSILLVLLLAARYPRRQPCSLSRSTSLDSFEP